MAKLEKSFFLDNEVLFWDQTNRGVFCPISKGAYKAFIRHGIAVHHVGRNNGRITELNSLPKVPKSAYVIYAKKDEQDIIHQLMDSGVKRILFHVLMAPSPGVLKECKENGVETVIGCPMMVFGLPVCKIHALFC